MKRQSFKKAIMELYDESYQLSGWFEKARTEYRQKIGINRLDALKTRNRRHPLLGSISLLAPLTLGLREIAHTSVLAWFLDPTNPSHGFDGTLLSAFLKRFADRRSGFGPISKGISVTREEPLQEERGRTDIRIEGSGARSRPWLIIIEAKINSGEQGDQRARYSDEAEKWRRKHKNGRVYKFYLVPEKEGHKASKGWTLLDYDELVDVLSSAAQKKGRSAAGYEFLRYYLTGVLKDVMGWPVPLKRNKIPYEAIGLLGRCQNRTRKGA